MVPKVIMEEYKVVACPTNEISYTNRAALNPGDSLAQFEHIAVRYPKKNEAYVFSVITDRAIQSRTVALNASGRKWASLMAPSFIEAAPYKFELQSQCLSAITFMTDFPNRTTAPISLEFSTDDMCRQFSQQFVNQAFTVGQIFGFAYMVNNKRVVFELKVKELEAIRIKEDASTSNVEIGLTTANTIFMFEPAEGSPIKLVGGMMGNAPAPKIFNQNWDFEAMGIGGLSEQFAEVFRRAFISRLMPPSYTAPLKIKHVRGMLLYGPPGTGKTLIARQIGQTLLAREPKVVNGPEVLNKFVGESEANIRKLFADAEEEQAKKGLDSALHVIIFDEIDAICKARGSSAGSSGVGDNVVNQLLSKIDGVNALHNVLLIGMTNRRDLIDEALLRPGRLELQIEIGIPNKEGRLEILKIHTKELREKNVLDSSVSLEKLSEYTKNYTGAEIAGLINAALSYAFSRVIKFDVKTEVSKEMLESIKVTPEDFQLAMDHDIKPALGADEVHLKELAEPMIQWDPMIGAIQSRISEIIGQLNRGDIYRRRPVYVLLTGESGSGLTTLAANTAMETKFPFIRVYQAGSTSDLTEHSRVQYIKKLFNDAARSELSCIVIDDLDLILDYCHIGPRFSSTLRNEFTLTKDIILPEGHKMLVICACHSESSLKHMNFPKMFKAHIMVPSITRPDQVENVINSIDSVFNAEQVEQLLESLGSIPFKMGIKELKVLIDDAFSDSPDQRVKRFLERMHELGMVIRKSRLDDLEF